MNLQIDDTMNTRQRQLREEYFETHEFFAVIVTVLGASAGLFALVHGLILEWTNVATSILAVVAVLVVYMMISARVVALPSFRKRFKREQLALETPPSKEECLSMLEATIEEQAIANGKVIYFGQRVGTDNIEHLYRVINGSFFCDYDKPNKMDLGSSSGTKYVELNVIECTIRISGHSLGYYKHVSAPLFEDSPFDKDAWIKGLLEDACQKVKDDPELALPGPLN